MLTLKAPENNACVPLLTASHKSFLAATESVISADNSIDWQNLVHQGEDQTHPLYVSFQWETDVAHTEAVLLLSENADFSAPKRITSQTNFVDCENLRIGHTYFWQVLLMQDEKEICRSAVFCFSTEATAPRWIHAGGISNVRDIGGWPLPDGKRIRQGMVFRGSEMEFHHEIDDHGRNVLQNELHIRTDLDLRGEAVGKISESALGKEVTLQLIPATAYDTFLSDSEKETARTLFLLFTDPENYPFYVHCWGGADRTGTLILMLCALLGMRDEDLFSDYELTSFSVWGNRSRNSDLFTAFLRALEEYGTKDDSIGAKCEAFLRASGLTEEDFSKIRSLLIEG